MLLKKNSIETKIYGFANEIFPYHRSITGTGVRKTLQKIKSILKNLKIIEVPSGTKAFDWIVPNEWFISEAYIIDPTGRKICDIKKNNLHVVSYSKNINIKIDLEELKKKLYSLPKQPSAIPYVTSYYKSDWGFCITENQKKKLKKGIYKAIIKSKHFKGSLTYGELLIKGKSKKEVLLSTYICHPSMANNEVSGPSVLTYLADWIKKLKNRKFSYRIIFVPETIGSIVYLNKNLEILKKNIIAGFVMSCIGDEKDYSYVSSRDGRTLSDFVAKYVLKKKVKKFSEYSWLQRGSDERQYCAPGVDLPICSINRTKPGYYPEYHTSLDKMGTVVTQKGLAQSFYFFQDCVRIIEASQFPKVKVLCEPFMSKKGLYPTISGKSDTKYHQQVREMMSVLSYCDGIKSLKEIAKICKLSDTNVYSILKKLKKSKVIKILNEN